MNAIYSRIFTIQDFLLPTVILTICTQWREFRCFRLSSRQQFVHVHNLLHNAGVESRRGSPTLGQLNGFEEYVERHLMAKQRELGLRYTHAQLHFVRA